MTGWPPRTPRQHVAETALGKEGEGLGGSPPRAPTAPACTPWLLCGLGKAGRVSVGHPGLRRAGGPGATRC